MLASGAGVAARQPGVLDAGKREGRGGGLAT